MTDVTQQYEMFVPRRRRIGGGGNALTISTPTTNHCTGLHWDGSAINQIETSLGQATFAFWSVLGSADGEFTRPRDPRRGNPIEVPLGVSGVTATAWYILDGQIPGIGQPGELETDAFLVDQNQFVDPTPIESVAPAAAWDHSDVQEFVLTTEASDVQARASVVDPLEEFEAWYALEGNAVPDGRQLHVPLGDGGIAVATFRVPPPPAGSPSGPRRFDIGGKVLGSAKVDGKGSLRVGEHIIPVLPNDPLLAAHAVFTAADGMPPEARTVVQTAAVQVIAAETRNMQAGIGG